MGMCSDLLRVISEFPSTPLALIPLFPCLNALLDKLDIRFPTTWAYSRTCVLQFLVQIQIFHHLGCDLVDLICVKLWYYCLKLSQCHFYHPFPSSCPYYTSVLRLFIASSPIFPTNAFCFSNRYFSPPLFVHFRVILLVFSRCNTFYPLRMPFVPLYRS